jgi:hypothetical protein
MFNRLIYENSATFFTVAAFVVAAVIFLTISIRTLRLRPAQVRQLEDLPFATLTPPATRESDASSSR